MSHIAIRVENLSKKYVISHRRERGYKTLCDVVTERFTAPWRSLASRFKYAGTTKNGNGDTPSAPGSQLNSELRPPTLASALAPRDDFWALKDVSFAINQGEVVGVIGGNGAGKSTLLKILSQITEPTKGRIEIDGRVASLLEVGTGFHPELTGRENIYLNGAILGMSRLEIRRKFDEIVDFAEIDKFLDTPVKRYSSGMYVRLAFAVAAHLEPEILIVDEVLAVGDAAFQRKCLGKMQEVATTGRAILFVSHNMHAIRNLCHRAIVLQCGSLVCDAIVSKAVDCYFGLLSQKGDDPSVRHPDKVCSDQIKYVDWEIIGGKLGVPHSCYSREQCCFRFTLVCRREIRGVRLGFAIRNSVEEVLLSAHSSDLSTESITLSPGTHFIEWHTRVPLQAGQYRIQAGVASENSHAEPEMDDDWNAFYKLEVVEPRPTVLGSEWRPLINEEINLRVVGAENMR